MPSWKTGGAFQADDRSESQRYFKENRAYAKLQAKVEVLIALMLKVQKARSINVLRYDSIAGLFHALTFAPVIGLTL